MTFDVKRTAILLISLTLVFFFAGCTRLKDPIVIIGRDEASGTRGSFDELVLDKNDPTVNMEALASNGFVHEKVSTTKLGIGYVGFSYLNGEIKPLEIDGIYPSESSVLEGSYPIARDLNMFTNGDPTGAVKDFIDFLFSNEGQLLVKSEGFISFNGTGSFTSADFPKGTRISIVGSTTVLPIGTVAAQTYMDLNPNVEITVSGGGSSTGIKSIGEGTADIGMSSRELKSTEIKNYPDLIKHAVAKDGIAAIVHKSNIINGLSLETLKYIYLGNYSTWTEVRNAEGTTFTTFD